MEIGKDELFFDSLPNYVLDEPLDSRDVLQDMLICLANLALDKDRRKQALSYRKRLAWPSMKAWCMDSVVVMFCWRHSRGRGISFASFAC